MVELSSWLVLLAFVVLVLVPVGLRIREVPQRLRDLREGVAGLKYVPVAVAVLVVSLVFANWLASVFPFLKWGWLGYNIVGAPLIEATESAESEGVGSGVGNYSDGSAVSVNGSAGEVVNASSGGGGGLFAGVMDGGVTGLVFLAAFLVVIVLAMVIYNYHEEAEYRGSYRAVGIWAVLHMLMGVQAFVIIPIFAVGLLYKYVHDVKGVRQAYAAHFGTNMVLVSLVALAVAVVMFG